MADDLVIDPDPSGPPDAPAHHLEMAACPGPIRPPAALWAVGSHERPVRWDPTAHHIRPGVIAGGPGRLTLMTPRAPGRPVPPASRPVEPADTTPVAPADWTDEEMLVRARAGEPEAFAELYRRYEADARRFARSLVPLSDVDDVVAESFAKVLNALSRDRGPRDEPLRYLMVAVRTTAFTAHRRRIRSSEVADKLAGERTPDSHVAPVDDLDLIAAFRSLPDRWRQVIWWYEVERLSSAEIAQRLGLSPTAASALAYRARRALRDAYLTARAEEHPQ